MLVWGDHIELVDVHPVVTFHLIVLLLLCSPAGAPNFWWVRLRRWARPKNGHGGKRDVILVVSAPALFPESQSLIRVQPSDVRQLAAAQRRHRTAAHCLQVHSKWLIIKWFWLYHFGHSNVCQQAQCLYVSCHERDVECMTVWILHKDFVFGRFNLSCNFDLFSSFWTQTSSRKVRLPPHTLFINFSCSYHHFTCSSWSMLCTLPPVPYFLTQ